MSEGSRELLAGYRYLDSTVEAIEGLKEAGFTEVTTFTPMPEHHVEEALGYGPSPVRVFTLAGGLIGAATGLMITIFTSMDWPLITGGKSHVSIPPFIIPVFELTILFGALFTLAGLFINIRLPNLKPLVIYHPDFSGGIFGVHVRVPSDRFDEARSILEASGPELLEDEREMEGRPEEEATGHA